MLARSVLIFLGLQTARSQTSLSPACFCSTDGRSGGVSTGRSGCWRSEGETLATCYVQEPSQCAYASWSATYNGAAWRYCDETRPDSVPTTGMFNAIEQAACACSALRSGEADVSTRPGCAAHDPRTPMERFCYVRHPRQCSQAQESTWNAAAAWRDW
ncbi:MAG: hypothetical protein MHM6MM_009193 [Cercozoa sp. M6MM]